MRELLMSPVRVKSEAINIPISAIIESYPERNGAMASERNMIITPERVRNERILAEILATILGSS